MSSALTEDHRWLIANEAALWLTRVTAETHERPVLPAYVKTLRRDIGATRTSLVLEQVQLRHRAKEKFSQADQLFFTPKGFEQATDELIAHYKGSRFPSPATNIDFCCGIGGDAFGMIQRGPVQLVDRDPLSLFFALENIRRLGGEASGETCDVSEAILPMEVAWHMDPDRRVTGQRTTRIELGEPGLETINALRGMNPHCAIKLAPATVLPDEWQDACSAEWIESRSECRQLVAWFGSLVNSVGHHTATRVERVSGATSFTGMPQIAIPETDTLGAFIYDPAPSLLAAHLLGAWCEQHSLQALSARSLYLTSDELLQSPLHQPFRHIATFPLDVTQLKAELRTRKIGRLEIKQRGMGITPESLRPQLQLSGDHEAVLILTEIGPQKRALLCERVSPA